MSRVEVKGAVDISIKKWESAESYQIDISRGDNKLMAKDEFEQVLGHIVTMLTKKADEISIETAPYIKKD